MATITAHILIGSGHLYQDGIEPSHRLYFLENSRPSLVLLSEVAQGGVEPGKVTWIPTLENTLEDALLMIAIHVIKEPEIVEMASQLFRSQENNWVVMYDDVNPQDLALLYQRCRALENTFKLVITVLRGSSIEDQLKVLDQYKMDLEVCQPKFVRLYSNWLNQTRVEGEL